MRAGTCITTRYKGATTRRGSRIEATIQSQQNGTRVRASIQYDNTMKPGDLHCMAAQRAAEKAGFGVWWKEQRIAVGWNDLGMVHVPVVEGVNTYRVGETPILHMAGPKGTATYVTAACGMVVKPEGIAELVVTCPICREKAREMGIDPDNAG